MTGLLDCGDQPSVDTLHKDLARARTGATNMIPTSTGAAVRGVQTDILRQIET